MDGDDVAIRVAEREGEPERPIERLYGYLNSGAGESLVQVCCVVVMQPDAHSGTELRGSVEINSRERLSDSERDRRGCEDHDIRVRHSEPGQAQMLLAFVSRQSMNVLLHALSERGLVTRAGEPGPRNQIAAQLTDQAQKLLDTARDRVETVVTTMTRGLDPQRLTALRGALVHCRDELAR